MEERRQKPSPGIFLIYLPFLFRYVSKFFQYSGIYTASAPGLDFFRGMGL